MLLTYSSGVIGLETLTVIGTVLPFSTRGGKSSLTLPVRTTAPPTTFLIAEASVAGVASAGRSVSAGPEPRPAALPARPRKRPRVDWSCLRIDRSAFLLAGAAEISHEILDLFSR